MELTLEKLFAQPDNEPVLRHMKLSRPEDVRFFEASTDGSPFDEGGQIFFHRYGRRIPGAARCRIGIYNLMAHERSARIFALHQGRLPYPRRRGVPRVDSRYQGTLYSETLDGTVDLRTLGPPWELFNWDDTEEEEEDLFWLAYEAAGS